MAGKVEEMITVEVSMKRAELLALAERLQIAALSGNATAEHTVCAHNEIGGEQVQIRFSNEDMEGVNEIYIELVRG